MTSVTCDLLWKIKCFHSLQKRNPRNDGTFGVSVSKAVMSSGLSLTSLGQKQTERCQPHIEEAKAMKFLNILTRRHLVMGPTRYLYSWAINSRVLGESERYYSPQYLTLFEVGSPDPHLKGLPN